jgi:DNA-directed RNA polymerase alpha subunit
MSNDPLDFSHGYVAGLSKAQAGFADQLEARARELLGASEGVTVADIAGRLKAWAGEIRENPGVRASGDSEVLLGLPIEVLELITAAYNALKRENINTLGELVVLTDTEIKDIPRLGAVWRGQVDAALARFGLRRPAGADQA